MKKKTVKKSKQKSNIKMLFTVFVLVAVVAMGFFVFNSYKNQNNTSGVASTENLMVDKIYSSVSHIAFNAEGRENCANQVNSRGNLVFASSYTLRCFNDRIITARTAPGANCQPAENLLADAKSYCESKKYPTPTYNPNDPWGKVTPVPAKKTTPTPTPKKRAISGGGATSVPKAPTRTPTPAPIKGVVWE